MSKAKETTVPNPFEEQVKQQAAIDVAKKRWGYNYGSYALVLKVLGKMDPEPGTKIPVEYEKLIKDELLKEAQESLEQQALKKSEGVAF